MIIKATVFVVMSVVVFMKFRKELFDFRRHGPYMFVAFEGLLALFILNGGSIFENALGSRQILSWALFIVSAGLALLGFRALRKYGQAVHDWENTTRLVREGVFKYIRHPLYASLMLLSTGMLLKDVTLRSASVFLLTFCFLVTASRVEEGENTRKFGAEYENYILTTKRYLPFII
jgi:protein-S-isoprenylcysteine O-methyltransferase Ste14